MQMHASRYTEHLFQSFPFLADQMTVLLYHPMFIQFAV